MHFENDRKILASWEQNAAAWADAISNNEIESRRLVTNQAIVDTIIQHGPRTMLDFGCGEGWLTRRLQVEGLRVEGIDAMESLLKKAESRGEEKYHLASFESIASGDFVHDPVDGAVCNFSLIGKDPVNGLMAALPKYLQPGGKVFIQTLHPLVANGDAPYEDGWRPGSWAGFGSQFTDPAPWYFRTTATWLELLRESRFNLVELREPLHPLTGKPASLILVGQANL